MIIFCQSFISRYYDDGPDPDNGPKLIRQSAIMFANKVSKSGDVISVSETATKWENSVTVWYKSMNKVEI